MNKNNLVYLAVISDSSFQILLDAGEHGRSIEIRSLSDSDAVNDACSHITETDKVGEIRGDNTMRHDSLSSTDSYFNSLF